VIQEARQRIEYMIQTIDGAFKAAESNLNCKNLNLRMNCIEDVVDIEMENFLEQLQ
jgi:hypothetical protein